MLYIIRFLQFISPFLLLNLMIEKLVNLPDKLNRNLISGIHCYMNIGLTLMSIVYSSNLLFTLAIFNSLGYFVHDLVYIIRKRLKEIGYITHHIIALGLLGYILSQEIGESFRYFFLITIGEMSNILIYPVYHLIQINNNSDKVEKLKWWQALIYTVFRIYGFPIYVLVSGIEHGILVYSLMVIYGMSYVWSYKILSKIERKKCV